mmetsp:Transcript_6426/g.9470  ORF Transcript_6426/g.9470 Transcript_6426/m.9470 type:complete len:518 (-) Transcript_6426:444-1997(-)
MATPTDPFAGVSLANMYIGEKPKTGQTVQQPSHDVWGLTPTYAPAATPSHANYSVPGASVAAQTPAPQSMQQAPAQNPYAQTYQQQQAYPPVMPVQQPLAYAPAAPMPAPMPAPLPQATAPPPSTQQPSATPYDPFSATPVAPAPAVAAPVSNPFELFSTSSSRDESPPPQRPENAPESTIVEIKDTSPEPSGGSAMDLPEEEADFWTQMGFAIQEEPAAAGGKPGVGSRRRSLRASIVRTVPKPKAQEKKGASAQDGDTKLDENGLPVGGSYFKPTLPAGYFGAVLTNAAELNHSIFATAPKSFVTALGDRPVVAYTSKESIVDKAGCTVGDVILKVQDEEVKNKAEALQCIRKAVKERSGYKGLTLDVWTPPSSIEPSLSENQCMTMYHGTNMNAPSTSWEWKSKYVVVGGVASDPWAISMYYNKGDYDIAVSQKQAKQGNTTVKVKTFSLLGAKLLTPKPKSITYSTQSQPWHFLIIKTSRGKAIKIGHPLREGLEPVFRGIEAYLKSKPPPVQ